MLIFRKSNSGCLAFFQEGADINEQDNKGMTGMMFACQLNNVDIVELILKLHTSGQQKADLSLRNKFGRTALEEAVNKKSAGAIALLSRLKKTELRKQYTAYGSSTKRKSRKPEEDPSSRPKSALDSFRMDISKSMSCDSLSTSVDLNVFHSYKRELADEFVKLSDKPGNLTSSSQSSLNKSKASSSREGVRDKESGAVGDLVLAVRQCAADIRQICEDCDIDYTKEKPPPPHSEHARAKPASDVDTSHHPGQSDGQDERQSKSSAAHGSDTEVLSRRQKRNVHKRKERHQDLAQLVNTLVMSSAKGTSDSRGGRNSRNTYGNHERVVTYNKFSEVNPVESQSGSGAISRTDNCLSISRLSTTPRFSNNAHVAIGNDPHVTQSSHSMSPDQKRLCDRKVMDKVTITPTRDNGMSGEVTLQVPIDCQALTNTGYFRQGKPKKSKSKKKHRKKKETSPQKNSVPMYVVPTEPQSELKPTEPVKWPSFRDPLPSIPCTANMASSKNGVCLPPLRESLRFAGSSNHRPIKLQSLDRDLWGIIEASTSQMSRFQNK